ncbi:MAG: hypothetical protein AAF394_19840, partial [Planctomycetota bacterium]
MQSKRNIAPQYSLRRGFFKGSAAAVGLLAGAQQNHTEAATAPTNSAEWKEYDFAGPDSLYHGNEWESLNPGYWQVKDNALRRRLHNVG